MNGGTALGRVLGSGSGKDGAGHWWIQRVTAVALLPLSIWFLLSLVGLPLADHAGVVAWIATDWHAVLLCLLTLTLCWHSSLGVQVVIEDYVHGPGLKVASLLAANFAHVLVAASGVFAVLRIALGTR